MPRRYDLQRAAKPGAAYCQPRVLAGSSVVAVVVGCSLAFNRPAARRGVSASEWHIFRGFVAGPGQDVRRWGERDRWISPHRLVVGSGVLFFLVDDRAPGGFACLDLGVFPEDLGARPLVRQVGGLRLAGRGEKIHERVCRCGGRVPIHEVWRARRTTATIRTDLGVRDVRIIERLVVRDKGKLIVLEAVRRSSGSPGPGTRRASRATSRRGVREAGAPTAADTGCGAGPDELSGGCGVAVSGRAARGASPRAALRHRGGPLLAVSAARAGPARPADLRRVGAAAAHGPERRRAPSCTPSFRPRSADPVRTGQVVQLRSGGAARGSESGGSRCVGCFGLFRSRGGCVLASCVEQGPGRSSRPLGHGANSMRGASTEAGVSRHQLPTATSRARYRPS